MSKKNFIKEAENKIKNYFFIENKIKVLENTVEDLENQIESIQKSIKDLNFLSVEKIDIKSPNIESINAFNNNTSYIESGILKQIEEKENLIVIINNKIDNYKSEIEILVLNNSQMKNIVNILSEEYKEMLHLRYFENKSEVEISNTLNISISQYHNKKRKVIREIHNLMIMYKEI